MKNNQNVVPAQVGKSGKKQKPPKVKTGGLKRVLKAWQLYFLLLPALIWAAVFAYYPMYGLIIAFKEYKGRLGILGSP